VIGSFTDSAISTGYQNIAVDSSGNVWVGGNNSSNLYELNPGAGIFSAYSSIGGQGLNHPTSVSIDGSGDFWLANAYDSQILDFSSPSGLLNTYGYAGYLNPIGANMFDAVEDGNYVLYSVETYGGGFELGIQNKNAPGNNLSYTPIESITGGGTLDNLTAFVETDSQGNAYTMDGKKLYEFDTTSLTWTLVDTLSSPNPNLSLTPFSFDSQGNIWSSTYNTGNDNNNELLEYNAGAPEPSTLASMAAALAALAVLGRRAARRRAVSAPIL